MCCIGRVHGGRFPRISQAMKVAKSKIKKDVSGSRAILPNKLTEALGENLRRYRKAAGMTQVDLAYDCELERSRVSKMENGLLNPSLLTMATLCYCLDIKLRQLFEGINATHAPTAHGGKLRRANQATLDKPAQKLAKRNAKNKSAG